MNLEQVLPHLTTGGTIRRKSWAEKSRIYLSHDLEGDEIIQFVAPDGGLCGRFSPLSYEFRVSDIKATDWEVVSPGKVEEDYNWVSAFPLPSGEVRHAQGEAVVLDSWWVEDRTDCWWFVENNYFTYSESREHLLSWRKIERGQEQGYRFGPGEHCYGDGPIWAIRRSATGLVFVSSDGYGLELFSANKELKEDDK